MLNSSCRRLNSVFCFFGISHFQSFVPHILKRPRNRFKKSGNKICSNAQVTSRQISGHGELSADLEHPLGRAIEYRTLDRSDWARQNCASPQGPKPAPRKARTTRVCFAEMCFEGLCFEEPYFPTRRPLQPGRLTARKRHQSIRPARPFSNPAPSSPAEVEKSLVPANEPVTTQVPPTLPEANFALSRNVATPSLMHSKDICHLQ